MDPAAGIGMPATVWRSRVASAAAVVALLLCALVLHREVLLAGEVYHMDDAADGYYPGHIAVARAFAHGELPVWERGSWCGWPLVADPYNGIFYPLNLVYHLVGAARGLGYSVALHIFLGGLGVWSLLRRRRLSVEEALFGALAYELSTFGVVRIRHVIFVQMMGWLPWILVGVERYVSQRRARDLAFVAVATGLALVAGALSIGHFAALAIAGYTLGRCIPARGEPEPLRRFLVDAGALAGAAVLGALLAAAQIVPTVAHLPLSPRALGSDYAFASSYAWPNLRYALTLLSPDLYGGEDRYTYVGAPNHWELCGWYVGAACAALSPLSLLSLLRRFRDGDPASRRVPHEVWICGGLVALAMSLAVGDGGPMHRLFYRFVPLYASLRCPARALLIEVLLVPILGAHGLSVALDLGRKIGRSDGERAKRGPLALALGLPALAILVAVALFWRHHHAHAAASAGNAQAMWNEGLLRLDALLVATFALVLLGTSRLVPRRAAAALLALLLAADLMSVGRSYVATQHHPADYPQGMERFAAVDWLVQHQDGARFVNDPQGPFRLHNLGLVLGLENASGYDSVGVWRYVELLYLINTGHRYPYPTLRDDFAGIGLHNLSSPLLDLMNIRWLIAKEAPRGQADTRWLERFHPVAPTGAVAGKYEPTWDLLLRVFENRRVLPRGFVVHEAEFPGSDDKLAARLVSPGFDPARTVLLEEPPPSLPPQKNQGEAEAAGAKKNQADAQPRTEVEARQVVAERSRVVFEVDDPRPGVLVVGDVDYPGWSATVDGAPARILRADWAFRAVPLAAGKHRVEMTFRSRPTDLGVGLSLLGMLLVCALLLPRRR